MANYVDEVLEIVRKKNSDEPEFIQTVTEILESLRPLVDRNEEEYRSISLLERLVEPEKVIAFRIPWEDDSGKIIVNRGWKIQFSSAIGPYKGGIRFDESVNLGILRFLSFEQIFKNSLTGLPIGGGKGGSDFDPHGKSNREIMRFCQSFMTGLYHYIGANMDCPAGDMGCGSTELGYMFGQYKRLINTYEAGVLSGKPLASGGIQGRDTATGFGAVYLLQELLADDGMQIEGLKFGLSGYGNAAWGVAKKASELGGKVVAISGRDGYVYIPEGIKAEEVDYMLDMRASHRGRVEDFATRFGYTFVPGEKPWGKVGADVYVPCATQNEISGEDAAKIAGEGTAKILMEVSNMPVTPEATACIRNAGIQIIPYKAANAGGVGVSALEMTQNAEKTVWSLEEEDAKLHEIMSGIYRSITEAAEKYGVPGDLIAGANLAAAERVFRAMVEQGVC